MAQKPFPFYSEVDGETVNVVDGLFAIAEALQTVARGLHRLGLAEASTPMGALEVLSLEVRDGFNNLCAALIEREKL